MIEAHENAFLDLAAVQQELLSENMRRTVLERHGLAARYEGRPARARVLRAPHIPDGRTIRRAERVWQEVGHRPIMPDKGKVERFIHYLRESL